MPGAAETIHVEWYNLGIVRRETISQQQWSPDGCLKVIILELCAELSFIHIAIPSTFRIS